MSFKNKMFVKKNYNFRLIIDFIIFKFDLVTNKHNYYNINEIYLIFKVFLFKFLVFEEIPNIKFKSKYIKIKLVIDKIFIKLHILV